MIAEALFFSGLLFSIGVVGVLTRRNALIVFMCVELMLNAVNLSFVALSRMHGGAAGQEFEVFGMNVAAVEEAVGLAILAQIFALTRPRVVERFQVAPGYGARQVAERGAIAPIAEPLFNEYLLAFEVTSVLLLVAIVGAVILGKPRRGIAR